MWLRSDRKGRREMIQFHFALKVRAMVMGAHTVNALTVTQNY